MRLYWWVVIKDINKTNQCNQWLQLGDLFGTERNKTRILKQKGLENNALIIALQSIMKIQHNYKKGKKGVKTKSK